jgi:hypothetical protein
MQQAWEPRESPFDFKELGKGRTDGRPPTAGYDLENMRSKRNSAARNEIKTGQALEYSVLRGALRYPGLTSKTREIRELAEDLPKMLAVFNYKRETPCLWVVFLGGTGTGKSTLFNALCGEELSETGVERPKTSGPIAYAH